MAKEKTTGADYKSELNMLKLHGPRKLYFIWGEEDYLRERYIESLREAAIGPGEDDFNYRRMDGRNTQLRDIEEAINAIPFMGERSFVELRDFDINGCRENNLKRMKAILDDIPDYCCVALIQDIIYEPDGRAGLVKCLKEKAHCVEFLSQGQGAIVPWIGRRFKELGKDISRADAEYLIFTSGSLMNQLIPEIEKLSGYVKGNTVTKKDIDAVAIKLPEARIFELTDAIVNGNYDAAAHITADLLLSREPAIKILSIISQQIRNMYASKLMAPGGRGDAEQLREMLKLRQRFMAEKLINSVRRQDMKWLSFACQLCAEYDFKMKSSSADDEALLKELVARLALGA